ncbi:MAG: conjugal transfer protein TraF [Gammaproteobacteria bacterium]|nr:conjugal transfer protein TraF [Gammaproteobacteria bacterium]
MKKIQNTLIGAAIALTSFQAAALPFAGVDARSLGMGGTGVAGGSVANAASFNPALLAASREGEDFNFSLAFGALAKDEYNMVDAVDALQAPNALGFDLVQQFSADIDAYIASPSTTTADPVIASGGALKTNLLNLNNRPLELGVNFGLNVTVPGETLGMSVFANSRGVAAGSVFIDPADLAAIDAVVTAVSASGPTADPFASGTLSGTSNFTLTGAAVTEVGVALGTKLFGLALGVTPKQVQIDSISSIQQINAASTSFPDTGETFSDTNFDVGVAIDLGALKIGGVAKNMVSKEYPLIGGNRIIIEPQLRAGVSFDAGWATLTMDQDLTTNKGVISTGVAAIDALSETQYTSLGVEFDMSIVQLRAGMRTDNTGNTDDVLTAGVGLHALVSLDFAVAGNDKGVEAILQAGVRW